MGRSKTPKYRLIIGGTTLMWTGKPTSERLREHVMQYAKSLEPGGCNAHISEGLGYIPYPSKAWIETNGRDSITVAEWKAAMFQCW